jgi:hypothetical protein
MAFVQQALSDAIEKERCYVVFSCVKEPIEWSYFTKKGTRPMPPYKSFKTLDEAWAHINTRGNEGPTMTELLASRP